MLAEYFTTHICNILPGSSSRWSYKYSVLYMIAYLKYLSEIQYYCYVANFVVGQV